MGYNSKQTQRDRFIEAARELGADEAAFKEKLARIARQKLRDLPLPSEKDAHE